MSNVALFIIGLVISGLVVFSVGGLIYAAHLDGEYQRHLEERQSADSDD